eukprot:CAMPEP_0182905760 /NCGR_PEP_ID=MMETSP0034_2-20130328/33194_1 /TAXON_ID=156128 /ORGANISM="Nephroselmis pyriformis, Strain CCMP717" /LENGTH=36 /DNA_ID= /DNA_START= /DNA_END= /DNA_ORIENTATION=
MVSSGSVAARCPPQMQLPAGFFAISRELAVAMRRAW